MVHQFLSLRVIKYIILMEGLSIFKNLDKNISKAVLKQLDVL